MEEPGLRHRALRLQGEHCYRADDGIALARRDGPDLVLLDSGEQDSDGFEALRRFRYHLGIPTIVLAGRRELDEVLSLEMGSDDSISKPAGIDVLQARIKSVLRRCKSEAPAGTEPVPLVVGDLEIDPAAHVVKLDGRDLELPPREFELLYTLALKAGRVLSVNKLLSRVWGADYVGNGQIVHVYMYTYDG